MENLITRDLGESGRKERGGREDEGRGCFWVFGGRTVIGLVFIGRMIL